MRRKKIVVLMLCIIMTFVLAACGKPAEEIGKEQPGQEDTMREEAPDATEPTAGPAPTESPDVIEPTANPVPTESPDVTEPTAEPVPTEAPNVTEPTAEPAPTEAPEEPVETVSRNETPASAFQYTIQDGEVIIEGLIDNLLKEVCIPEKIEGYPVTAIASNAFSGGSEMESLDIPGTVEDVAFFMVVSPLKKLTLQEGVKTIGYHSFYENQMLEEVHIPDSVIAIYDGALPATSWIENQMGDNDFLIVGDGILYAVNSNVSGDIVIPEGVKSIADQAFASTSVDNVLFPTTLEEASIVPFLYTNWYANLPYTMIGKEELIINDALLLWVSPWVEGDYVVPENVKKICRRAFDVCDYITSITIPEGVVSVKDPIWVCSSLTDIKLPKSATEIYIPFEYMYYGGDTPAPVVTVPAGSYAEQWADENGYGYILAEE